MSLYLTLALRSSLAILSLPMPAGHNASRTDRDTVTASEVEGRYGSMIGVVGFKLHGQLDWAIRVRRHPASPSAFGEFAAANPYFVTYLVQHGTGFNPDSLVGAATGDAKARTEALIKALRADDQFNNLLLTTVRRFLSHRGVATKGFPQPQPPSRIGLQEALSVATRFFYPDGITPNGRIASHICVSLNAVRDLPSRNIELEAMLYQAIMKDLQSQHFGVQAAFDSVMTTVGRMQLSRDPAERLARAQGAAWALMAREPALRNLVTAALTDRPYMPVTLTDHHPNRS